MKVIVVKENKHASKNINSLDLDTKKAMNKHNRAVIISMSRQIKPEVALGQRKMDDL